MIDPSKQEDKFEQYVKSYIRRHLVNFMAKNMGVGEPPVQPIRKRRAKTDGYERVFIILWLNTLVICFLALAWWVSSENKLAFSFVYNADTEMKRLAFITCVSFLIICSFVLLRFDSLAKARERIDFEQKMDRFHELDKRHIEREALEIDMSIDRIRGGGSSIKDSVDEKNMVNIPIVDKGDLADATTSDE